MILTTNTNTGFDHHLVNHMTVAVGREMVPHGCRPHDETDTLFMGGPPPSDADMGQISGFALRKNYKIVFASYHPADPDAGPISYDLFVNDGLEDAVTMLDGKLWKRDRRSAAVLVFPRIRGIVKLGIKGQLLVQEMSGLCHEAGYELAREAVLARAAQKPGTCPVVSPIGKALTVIDIRALQHTFAMAA